MERTGRGRQRLAAHGRRRLARRIGAGVETEAFSPGRDGAVGDVVQTRGPVAEAVDAALDGGVVALPDEQGVAGQIVAHHRDVGAAVVEVPSRLEVEGILLHPAFVAAHARLDGEALEVAAQDRVDHARDRVRAEQGGGAVSQHFNPLHAHDRDGVGVDGRDRHIVFDLGAGVGHQAAAVQQRQGVAGAQRPQVDRGHVAARAVDAAIVGVGVVEVDVARLRDGAIQVVAVDSADGVDVLGADDRDRQGFVDAGALNAAADHHDFVDLSGLLCLWALAQDEGRSLVADDLQIRALDQQVHRRLDIHDAGDGAGANARQMRRRRRNLHAGLTRQLRDGLADRLGRDVERPILGHTAICRKQQRQPCGAARQALLPRRFHNPDPCTFWTSAVRRISSKTRGAPESSKKSNSWSEFRPDGG
ncbi:hypothetical protein D3C87_1122090 [compost metagenome]